MKQLKRWLSLLLILAMLLPMIYVGPVAQVQAASSYISTSYPANLSVKTTKSATLMKEPSTQAASAYVVAKDTMLTVKALHKNTAGTYWYEVLYYGLTLFVDATAATLVDHLTGDVTVSDLMTPAALGYGQGFPLGGTITSKLNKLGKVTASVHYHSNIHKEPAITSSATVNGYSYSLQGNAVDNNMIYSDLPTGSYTHMLTAEAISYYINDSGELTTSTKTVVLDNKPLVVTLANSNNPIVAKGIDVSVWNGDIDWAAVSTQVDFAILRLGWETTLDTRFTENAAGCNANGVPFGVYIYSYAENEAEAIAEAQFAINALKNYDVDLPIFFDIEDECQSVLGAAAIQNIVKAFCNTIRDAGYEPGLYTFLSWFNSYFGDSYYNSLPKWVAQIDGSACSYGKGVTMWQYSWVGSFNGMSGDVDCNYYFGEFPGKNSDTSYLSKCTYYPSNLNATVIGAAELRQYPSSDYTLLDTMAAGTKVRVTGVYKNAYGNYWYQVEKDGVTGYTFHDNLVVDEYLFDDLSVVDPKMDNIALNSGYYLKGWLRSVYNQMTQINARIYSGEDTTVSPALSSSAAVNTKEYTLSYSDVCDALHFNKLSAGYYTYEISADVKNYYVDNGTLTSKNENVVVWTAPFTVGGAAITPPESVACQHSKVTQPAVAPTCSATGLTEGSYCSKCGEIFATQTVIPATGHSYTSKILPATCQEYERVEYTCGACGDNYSVYTNQSDWTEILPEGVPAELVETKTQYRYSDYETKTSNAASLAGYTQLSKKWVKKSSGSVQYPDSWPAGFDTSNELYKNYNNKPYTAGETATTKTEVGAKELIGHIMWHWCSGDYSDGPYNRTTSKTKTDYYDTFHAFATPLASLDPRTLTPASDGSVTYSYRGACGDTWWWYYTPIYYQTYATYEAEFTYERWTDWSAWSDAPIAATSTRKVETRTLYRYFNGELGDHTFEGGLCIYCGESQFCPHPDHNTDGICAKCGETVPHTYVDGTCSVCGKAQEIKAIKPAGSALSFKDEAQMKIYFTTENLGDVALADMGLLTWNVPKINGTLEDARAVVSGVHDAGDGVYWVATKGIPAKNLGDTIYFKVYAKLADGTYVYSPMMSTSPKAYAMNQINHSSSKNLRALCVALLNYGAAAQEHFGYKVYDLMNAGLTDAQRAYVQEYDASMVYDVPAVPAEKLGMFVRNAKAFKSMYANVNFGGAFAINYYFTPAYEMDGEMTLYFWDESRVTSLDELKPENAAGSMTMELRNGQYWGDLTGISARLINYKAYMAGVYTSNGVTYTTGVLPYSVAMYCKNIAANESNAARNLAMQTAVYGYYAKIYFGA